MLISYETLPETAVNITGSTSELSIDSCVFSDGVDVSGEALSGGLAILYSKENQYIVDVSLYNVVSARNMAKSGANFLFSLHIYLRATSI